MSDIHIPAEVEAQPTEGEPRRHATRPPQEGDQYICDWPGCDRTFPTEQGVQMHKMRVHTGQISGSPMKMASTPGSMAVVAGRELCTLCGRTITTARMPSHLRRVHNATAKPRGKQAECEICGNIFASQDSLRGHLRSMHGQGPNYPQPPRSGRERMSGLPNPPSSTTRLTAPPPQISDDEWERRAEQVAEVEIQSELRLNLGQFSVVDDVVILKAKDGSHWMLRRLD